MQPMTNSHILVHGFDYYEPATLAEAGQLLAQGAGRARALAGGTDLLVHMKMERAAPAALVSLNRIPGLDGITQVRDAPDGAGVGGLCIGARATIRTIETAPEVQAGYTALAEACGSFSSTQVQTMGTLGGNLANASPAADTAPALLACAARVELYGPDGERNLPLEQFFAGPGRSALALGEIITGVVLPPLAQGTGSAFLKMGRVANDIAKASCAVVLVRDGAQLVDCRIAFGSVAPVPMRARRAEALLAGQPWSEELVDAAARLAAQEIAPIDDVRSSAWYRREIAQVMAGDGLRRAWARAQAPTGGTPRYFGVATTVPDPVSDVVGEVAVGPAEVVTSRQALPALAAGERRLIELRVNGRRRQVWAASNDLLLNVLREDLQLTGTKYGCGIGECSACTVLLDGQPVLACLVLAVAAAGHEVTTIEGLGRPDGELDPLQEAFIDLAAYQCGYCTPGMLLTAKRLLAEKPQPSEEDVRHYLRGNLCRCTGYASIVRAVLAAAERQAAGAQPAVAWQD